MMHQSAEPLIGETRSSSMFVWNANSGTIYGTRHCLVQLMHCSATKLFSDTTSPTDQTVTVRFILMKPFWITSDCGKSVYKLQITETHLRAKSYLSRISSFQGDVNTNDPKEVGLQGLYRFVGLTHYGALFALFIMSRHVPIYRLYHLKRNTHNNNHAERHKNETKSRSTAAYVSDLHRDPPVHITPADSLGRKAACRSEYGIFTSTTCVHSRTLFRTKSFVVVREAFNNAYPEKEVPNKVILTNWQLLSPGRRQYLPVTGDNERQNSLNYDFKHSISCNNTKRQQELSTVIGYVAVSVCSIKQNAPLRALRLHVILINVSLLQLS
jgi:hypothetical protein